MTINQAYIFLIFAIDGIIIGLLFDFFRILRKSFKTSNIMTYIEDIIFWILTGIIVMYSIYVFCDGEIRWFMFVGIAIGLGLYILTFSKYIIKISVKIIDILKSIINIILKPIKFICDFIKNNVKKHYDLIKLQISQKNTKKLNKKEGF